jgi:hypothetical protein
MCNLTEVFTVREPKQPVDIRKDCSYTANHRYILRGNGEWIELKDSVGTAVQPDHIAFEEFHLPSAKSVTDY